MSNPAPITLFVYNRPWHTLQTVEALQKNDLASESVLFIYADGPKKPEHAEKVREVREYVRNISGFRSVTIVERDENFGLAKSIITGVTEIVNRFGRIIVLEDDLVTSPYFLRYMNDALEMYEGEERVISVHAYTFPVSDKLPETFFLKGTGCWGWGTWARGWELFEPDGRKLLNEIISGGHEFEFNFNGVYPYTKMLEDQISGRNDSWAVRWYASGFLNGRLALHFGESLTANIGVDGSGTHCDKDEMPVRLCDRYEKCAKVPSEPDAGVMKLYCDYFKGRNRLSFVRIRNMFYSLARKLSVAG